MLRPIQLLAVIALCGAALLAGCTGKADLEKIESPAVGDLYAAELSAFSDYGFSDDDGNGIEPAYGLLQVIAVNDAQVVVITENAGSQDRTVARTDLKGDLVGIAFDDSEKIAISRPDLRKAWDDKLIFGVRRR